MKLQYITIALVALLFTSCNDFLDIRPTGKVIAETGEEYRALLTYVYDKVPEDRGMTTLRSDEMAADASTMSGYDYDSYYDIWNWTDYNRNPSALYFGWRRYYHTCYIANYIIEHQREITKATDAEIKQLVGESYMLRAYMHFLLVNLYAPAYTNCTPETTRGIPLQLKADVNAVLSCSSVADVYKQILNDIAVADEYMNVEKWEQGYNYRFSKDVVSAFRARVALYMGDWQLAFDEAEKVIEKYPALQDLVASTSTKPTNYKSVESIMALEQIITTSISSIGYVNPDLLSMYRTGDQRKSTYFKAKTLKQWVLRKEKDDYDNERCSFRSGEFYLIAAEAANELNDKNNALKYIKELMQKRYKATNYNTYSKALDAMDKDALREEIAAERQREMAYQGHRWFDLRRTTQPQITKVYTTADKTEETFVLEQADARYTLRFPTEAVEANPGLELWQ
ncbi:MAG: RagB/SusD family nutrient uptake outer membrane protein [Muribaculaceae bacterium]|nr:RagB/SusD family nutrient uptake outer membrane protein [Muribaculaceae bacterium]